jgi:hypothetical protein
MFVKFLNARLDQLEKAETTPSSISNMIDALLCDWASEFEAAEAITLDFSRLRFSRMQEKNVQIMDSTDQKLEGCSVSFCYPFSRTLESLNFFPFTQNSDHSQIITPLVITSVSYPTTCQGEIKLTFEQFIDSKTLYTDGIFYEVFSDAYRAWQILGFFGTLPCIKTVSLKLISDLNREKHNNLRLQLGELTKTIPIWNWNSCSSSKCLILSNHLMNITSRKYSTVDIKPSQNVCSYFNIQSSFPILRRKRFHSHNSKYLSKSPIFQNIISLCPKQSSLKRKNRMTASCSFGDKIHDLSPNKHDINMSSSIQLHNEVKEIQSKFSLPSLYVLPHKNLVTQECDENKQEQVKIMSEDSYELTEASDLMLYFSSDEEIDNLLESIAGADYEEKVEEMDLTIFDLTRVYYSLATKPKLSSSEEDQLSIILELAKYDKELAEFIDKIDRDVANEGGLMTAEEFIVGLPHDAGLLHDQPGDM